MNKCLVEIDGKLAMFTINSICQTDIGDDKGFIINTLFNSDIFC